MDNYKKIGTIKTIFIIITAISLAIFVLKKEDLLIIIILILIFLLYFMRDPERDIADGIVSPADGIVTDLRIDKDGAYISIFMNIHNVHINRAPISCTVIQMKHMDGTHYPAYGDWSNNERMIYKLFNKEKNIELEITEIAGIVARRIIPFINTGQNITKGERIGMILFGSRVNLIVKHTSIKWCVDVGDTVMAGSSKIAEFKF
ncbi:MAG: phosphatidylserine decarboxylase [Candidatus Thermoplasmatota archaeon]|jgi:phosphatidylserine decarboxylase|nr:phosphatidylserine decarboxylase [Candidatus Thermoplasmatota archaeon]MCL5962910.1 phosphatidylserine decarboxylase [Candidatus Thermoplasmatota archaeon]